MRGILGRQPEAEEYQVALFPGYYARDRPSKKAKNLPGSDVTYRINSASIVINTHNFKADLLSNMYFHLRWDKQFSKPIQGGNLDTPQPQAVFQECPSSITSGGMLG